MESKAEPPTSPPAPAEGDTMLQIDLNNNGDEGNPHIQNDATKTSIPRPQKPRKSPSRHPKPKRLEPSNPLQTGILNYLNKHYCCQQHHNSSLFNPSSPKPPPLPKRFTIYPPLLLLPSNAFSSPPEWAALYNTLSADERQELYSCIATSFTSKGVTHIAMNAPIAPTMSARAAAEGNQGSGLENRIRSPTGLVTLFGDFGETGERRGGEERGDVDEEEKEAYPTAEALRSALWVRSVQNRGVVQIWAPLHSMFSRGNIVEKARILGMESRFEGLDDDDGGDGREGEGKGARKRLLGQRTSDIAVVDMYAGIGYFVFSYLKSGVGRVWGWEINGWSIEGLCRGCGENGWGVKVVKVDRKTGEVEGGIDALANGLGEEDRVVVFHGDNRYAAGVMAGLKYALERRGEWKRIRHVNLGLLPTSKQSWEGAVRVMDGEAGGWIHVHENVNVKEIERMEGDIVEGIGSLLKSSRVGEYSSQPSGAPIPKAECVHVERVKTYAPGVMHCVFDIYLPPSPGWFK
ncbi:hypothetical protein AJ79_03218 [Helicocarpus griseus UAMH5409]|uniref:tRNA(Phe) (4-demethylwyosine(37)-C(7)) aminocarboxypropyltransferase n=1 Tax=Helicocarpus griseus UAMH5409 TaxID=1447875 RepID=A0A2B7XZ95_9EURO|nr:hypothetical protein AJ79_03218 [Helicocarpus griseus UAMH5409]